MMKNQQLKLRSSSYPKLIFGITGKPILLVVVVVVGVVLDEVGAEPLAVVFGITGSPVTVEIPGGGGKLPKFGVNVKLVAGVATLVLVDTESKSKSSEV